MKVHLRTVGCRLNQAEIDQMAHQLMQQGHTITDAAEEADQVIVNTCAVTHDAVKSGRRLIAELHRSSPNAAITATGCHAQLAPQAVAVLPGVTRVVGNAHKDTLVEQITGQAVEPFDLEPHERDTRAAWRTRAFVKVQDGCDNACTFCITTVARGKGRSRPADEILHEIRALHALGYQEVVLTGVHLGSYGHDWQDQQGLYGLTQRILNETDVPRIRLSSLEPWDIATGFFALWDNPRLCPHLHLPLQSGCDATLKRMRRNTTTEAFRALVADARAHIADVRITSDLIVGFPGETNEEFEASAAFVAEVDFAGLHVFRYSTRADTPAARMRDQVSTDAKKARSQQMHVLSHDGERRFAERYVGTCLPVLWETISGAAPEGFINVGYTHNYLRVQAVHPRILTNTTTLARLIRWDTTHLRAVPVIE